MTEQMLEDTVQRRIFVSVVVVTYNQEAYISQALDSILMQKTNFYYEVLVGDDASTDGTGRIVEEYAERYPGVIFPYIRPVNLGATRNAYALLQRMRGEYFAFLDGDDYWIDPYKLQKQVDFLISHPQYIGFTHALRYVDQNNHVLKRAPHWVSRKKVFTLRDFDGIRLPGQASSLVRRNIFLHPEHDYSILTELDRMISDRTSALIFLLQGDFYRFDEIMGAYRYCTDWKGDNLTSQLYRKAERIMRDYEIACGLEQYARDEFGVSKSFEPLKQELYAKALLRAIQNRSAELFFTARQIRRNSKHPYRTVCTLPYHVIRLIWRHRSDIKN